MNGCDGEVDARDVPSDVPVAQTWASRGHRRAAPEENRMFHLTFQNMLGVIGACVVVYYVGVRGVATIADVYQRWRNDDWEI